MGLNKEFGSAIQQSRRADYKAVSPSPNLPSSVSKLFCFRMTKAHFTETVLALPEAERLCGFALRTGDDLLRAGTMLLSLGPKAVLIKGGHGAGDTLTDLLFTRDADPRAYIAKRVDTSHTHGTGCTLSSAIA